MGLFSDFKKNLEKKNKIQLLAQESGPGPEPIETRNVILQYNS
jgi:hypothetical protein